MLVTLRAVLSGSPQLGWRRTVRRVPVSRRQALRAARVGTTRRLVTSIAPPWRRARNVSNDVCQLALQHKAEDVGLRAASGNTCDRLAGTQPQGAAPQYGRGELADRNAERLKRTCSASLRNGAYWRLSTVDRDAICCPPIGGVSGDPVAMDSENRHRPKSGDRVSVLAGRSDRGRTDVSAGRLCCASVHFARIRIYAQTASARRESHSTVHTLR